MANLTTVGLTAGVPTSGTGTVSTLDGTFQTANGPIAIKPASTAAAMTDTALVVAISPNGVNANGQTTMTGSAPVVIASDQSAVAGNITKIGGTALALGQTTMSASVPVAIASDQGALTTVQSTTAGGQTILSTIMASGTNATSVKASAGKLYKVEIFNNSSTVAYLKLYNTAGTPTAGSGTPVWRMMVPANGGVASVYETGLTFGTGIGYTFTSGQADADTTSVAATTYIVNIGYK